MSQRDRRPHMMNSSDGLVWQTDKNRKDVSRISQSSNSDPIGRLLKIGEVIAEVGLSRAMIYRCIGAHENPFPKPLKIGNASRWSFVEVVQWKQTILRSRDEKVE